MGGKYIEVITIGKIERKSFKNRDHRSPPAIYSRKSRGGRFALEFRRPCLKSGAPLLGRDLVAFSYTRREVSFWFAEQLARLSSGCHKPPAICFASVCRAARADPTKAVVRHRHRRAPSTTFCVDNSRSCGLGSTTVANFRSRLGKRED